MNNVFDIDDLQSARDNNPYLNHGFPRNPFREDTTGSSSNPGPFYSGHIEHQITEIKQWIRDTYEQRYEPLSLVGNIGTGKTRILNFIRASQINNAKRHLLAEILVLSKTGYARASVGGTIISALQRMKIPWIPQTPEGSLPIIWATVTGSGELPRDNHTPLGVALRKARLNRNSREANCITITRWLQREYIRSADTSILGLTSRIDWEGELIHVLSDLFRFAHAAEVAESFFLFFDQLEDLFRPDLFSDLRRSRLLTDLRALVDETESNCPLGLILSWTPDFSSFDSPYILVNVERKFQQEYQALYSRLAKRRVVLDLLSLEHAAPFAATWVDSLKAEEGFVPNKQPHIETLVVMAWEFIRKTRLVQSPGRMQATPRAWLSALAASVDQIAGVAPPQNLE